jgi:hypothetical protein
MFALFFTACNPTTLKDSPAPVQASSELKDSSELEIQASPLPVSNQNTDDNDLKIIDEDSIKGNYTLKRGLFGTQEITEGYLVVEEIDVNNYGYYYVTVTEEFSPETHTGIFYNQGGKYVQKVIEDSSEAEIRQGKKKSKMSIIDNISIKQKGELLTLHINSTKNEKLFWIRDSDEVEKSKQLVKTLASAKSEYESYYKDKCVDCEEFCGSAEYTKVSDKN